MKRKNTKAGGVIFLILLSIFANGFSLMAGHKGKSGITALIVTGQNNHYWPNSTPIFRKILEDAKIFKVDVAQSPAKGGDMSTFNPPFSAYDVVVLDYNGDTWNDATKKKFEAYVKSGGGVVVIHAADNSFPDWEEYNKIIGLGGWGNRNEKSGPFVYWKENKPYRDYSAGRGGGHGSQSPYNVITRDPKHPIMKGLPMSWKHAQDELYGILRGPALNMEILATAYSKNSKRDEPILFTIKYGKGRVFHTVMGHVSKTQNIAVQCAGFVYTLQRGTEWAATGKVKQKLPNDMPDENTVRLLTQYNITGN